MFVYKIYKNVASGVVSSIARANDLVQSKMAGFPVNSEKKNVNHKCHC